MDRAAILPGQIRRRKSLLRGMLKSGFPASSSVTTDNPQLKPTPMKKVIKPARQRVIYRSTCSIMALLFCVLTGSVHSADYYFSTSGNDANATNSQTTPWQSLSKAASVMSPGNKIHLKRGDVWYQGDVDWVVTNKLGTGTSPIVVDDGFGSVSNAPPIIAHMVAYRSGWVPVGVGTNIWKHTKPTFSATNFCFINGYRKGLTNSITLTSTNQYAVDSTYVYVKNVLDPGTNALVEVNAGTGPALYLQNSYYIAFRNLIFSGGGSDCVLADVPTEGIKFDSCQVIRPEKSGIYFNAVTNSTARHTAAQVVNCSLNFAWQTFLNEVTNSPFSDGIHFTHVDGGTISNNQVTDFGHTSICLDGSTGCLVELNNTIPTAVNYERGLEVYLGSTDNIIRRNFFQDQRQVGSKLFGQRNKYYSNVFVGARLTDIDHNFEGFEARIGTIVTNEVVKDNLIVNNTFYDTEKHSLLVDGMVNNLVGQNTIKNNLFVLFFQGATNSYGLCVTTNGVSQIVENNCFWRSNSVEMVILDELLPKGTNFWKYTAVQANNLATNYNNNLQVNPGFVNPATMDFHLLSTSQVKTNGQNVSGVMGTGFVDFDGHAWANPPSIGAFQYVP